MTSKSSDQKFTLNVGSLQIQIVRKKIKRLYLSVKAPNAAIIMNVPLRISLKEIIGFAESRLEWMQFHIDRILNTEWVPEQKFQSGEAHYFLGKKYPLKVTTVSGRERLAFENGVFEMYVKSRSSKKKREKLMEEWYRARVAEILPELIFKWENRMGLKIKGFTVKKLRRTWGICHVKDRTISFSLGLGKVPMEGIEYVVVHELVHLFELHHNRRFYSLMTKYLPTWRKDREKLNSLN